MVQMQEPAFVKSRFVIYWHSTYSEMSAERSSLRENLEALVYQLLTCVIFIRFRFHIRIKIC